MMAKPETVFRTPWFQIGVVEPGAEASGTTEPYYCLIRQGGVMAFVLDEAGRVVLIEQYRPPIGRTTLEMPSGTIEEGETPDDAVAREVLEETGFRCRRWHQISPFRLMLNREDVIEYFYIGLGARHTPDYDLREHGTVRLFERAGFLELVRSRRFEQGAALGGLYLAEKIFGVDLLMADLDHLAERLTGQGQ
jgi:ADP-ribose pyrophosphatase